MLSMLGLGSILGITCAQFTGVSACLSDTFWCNIAYAMSKKALQDAVLRQIEERTVALDELLPTGMSDDGNRRAQDRRGREIMHK
jgi:enoyl-CoA hydratase